MKKGIEAEKLSLSIVTKYDIALLRKKFQ